MAHLSHLTHKERLSTQIERLVRSIPTLPNNCDSEAHVLRFLTSISAVVLGLTELFEKTDFGANLDDDLSDVTTLLQYVSDVALVHGKLKLETLESLRQQVFQFTCTLYQMVEQIS